MDPDVDPMKRLLIAVALTLLSSCSSRPRCDAYHFQRSFPAAYHDSARAAAAKWTAFSGSTVTIEDGDSDDSTCSIGSVWGEGSPDYQVLKGTLEGEDFFAIHRERDGAIFIAQGQWFHDGASYGRLGDFATSLLMHELGHEGGMGHVADARSVMGQDSPGTNMEYSAIDRAELERVR